MTSERSPVFSLLSFSICAIAFFRAATAASADMPGLTAPATRAVTSSMETRTFNSRSVDLISSAGVETDTRLLQMLEPLRRRLELIVLLQPLERWIVKQPHPFIGEQRRSETHGDSPSQ